MSYITKTSESQKKLRDWLALAKENLLIAQSNLNARFSPYHTICFLSQESAQKYLKAYLIAQGWRLDETDDLKKLIKEALSYDASFSALFSTTNVLNGYALDGFYPGESNFEHIDKIKAKEAIEAAEKIEQFVLSKLANFTEIL